MIMSEKQRSTYLGKIEFTPDEILFKHNKGEFPISLTAAQEEQIRKFPESQVILREGEGKPYIKICNTKDTVDKRVYSYYIKRDDAGRIERAGLRTFSYPYFDREGVKSFIEASEKNEVAGVLCFCPEKGVRIQIEGSLFMPQRREMSAQDYYKKVCDIVGHKINVLKNLGFDAKNFCVYFTNIQYLTFNKEFIKNNYSNLEEAAKKQFESPYGRYNIGYIPFSQSFSGILFANSLPVLSAYCTVNTPLFGAGRLAKAEDKEKYPIEDMNMAYKEDKERFAEKKTEDVEEESVLTMSM